MPNLFLPLACAANVAKNVGAVTTTSTRTPIYKEIANGENIGDVTAKGEGHSIYMRNLPFNITYVVADECSMVLAQLRVAASKFEKNDVRRKKD